MNSPAFDNLETFSTNREIVSILARFYVKHLDKLYKAQEGEGREPELNPDLAEIIGPSFRFNRRVSGYRQRCDILTRYLLHKLDADSDEEHIKALRRFIEKIQSIAASGDFNFKSPRLIPMYKPGDRQEEERTKTYVYRPLSAYDDLETKFVITLLEEFLSVSFDPYFHSEMLAYRRPRTYHGKENKTTTNKDAVPTIIEFLNAHKGEDIWVSECDIQKFFDILNHDVILGCFDSMSELVRKDRPDFDPATSRKLLESFLGSYSFYTDVYNKSKEKGEDSPFWRKYRGDGYDSSWSYQFKWISDDNRDRISDKNDYSDLGIPQGAALSTVIANIVLQSVDAPLIKDPDSNRLLLRYCDDVVIMHTNESECRRLSKAYAASLSEHRLLYHKFKSVSELKKKHMPGGYWDAKSKDPFRWGSGGGNAAKWIGFLGYEINRDGDVRIRQSSVGKKVEKMYRDLKQLRFDDNAERRARHLRKFKKTVISVPGERKEINLLSSHKGITENPWTAKQIRNLKKYREIYSKKYLSE